MSEFTGKLKILIIIVVGVAILGGFGFIGNLFIGDDNTESSYDVKENESYEYDEEENNDDESSEYNKAEPSIWMRESEIIKLLGKPDSIEVSKDFDKMTALHRYKNYEWDNGAYKVEIGYIRHFSNKVDDYIEYPEDNGYVKRIWYYDEDGVIQCMDELDFNKKGIYQ